MLTQAFGLALAIAFGNGVLSFAAPCTVALLPAYLGLLAGTSAGVPPGRRAGRLMLGSLLYVVGLTVVFVTLGFIAGATGSAIRLDEGPAQRIGGLLVLGVAALLLAEGRSGWLSRIGAAHGRPTRAGSFWVPLALGVAFGSAFTPCVGPFLATALSIAATSRDRARGGVLLFGYAVGIGVPFVLAAMGVAGSERLARRLARLSGRLCYLAAAVLGVLGVLLVSGRYDVLSGWLTRLVLVSSS